MLNLNVQPTRKIIRYVQKNPTNSKHVTHNQEKNWSIEIYRPKVDIIA